MAEVPKQIETTIWNVANGSARRELTAAKKSLMKQIQDLATSEAKLESAPPSAERTALENKVNRQQAKVQKLRGDLNQAIQAHDNMAASISKYTAGLYNVQKIGMAAVISGSVTALVWAGVAVAGLVAGAYFIGSIGDMIHGTGKETTSITGAVNRLVNTGIAGGEAVLKTAYAAGILFTIYIAWEMWERTQTRKAAERVHRKDVIEEAIKPIEVQVQAPSTSSWPPARRFM